MSASISSSRIRLASVARNFCSASLRRTWRPAIPAASSSISRRSVGLAAITALILPWLTRAGRVRAGRGVGEQQGDILLADVAAVDPIGGAGAALDPAGDLDLAGGAIATSPSSPPSRSTSIVTSAKSRAGPQRGAGEDHVVHAGAAHRFGRAFAHHPADRLQHVGFAAAVGADDPGQAVLDAQLGRLDEALEAGKFEPPDLHLLLRPPQSSLPRAASSGSSFAQIFEPATRLAVDEEGRRARTPSAAAPAR